MALLLIIPAIGLVTLLLALAIMYLLFLTPYIMVVKDVHLIPAISESVSMTMSSYVFGYAVVFMVISAVVSLVISFLMMFPWIGLIIALGVVAYVGTAMSISTMYYYGSLRRQTEKP